MYPDVMVVVRVKVDRIGPDGDPVETPATEKAEPQPAAGHGSVRVTVPV